MSQIHHPSAVEPTSMRMMGMITGLFRFAPLFFVGLIVWELTMPPAVSMVVNALEKIGMGSAASIVAQADAQAEYEHKVQIAISEVERLHDHYSKLAAAHTAVIQMAYQWEGEVLQSQLRMVENSQWANRVGSNVADVACLAGRATNDPEVIAAACGTAQEIRRGMAVDMVEILERHRTIIPQRMLESFPKPDQILSAAYIDLAAKYGDRK